jgi:hypothetical protein
MNYYSYFFTRQDISPEQQLVQTAHVALKLGVNSHSKSRKDVDFEVKVPSVDKIDPDQTYFTCVGVRNEDALYAVIQILEEFGFEHEVFREPDMNNEITAIAVYPISELMKGPLEAFNLLRMK